MLQKGCIQPDPDLPGARPGCMWTATATFKGAFGLILTWMPVATGQPLMYQCFQVKGWLGRPRGPAGLWQPPAGSAEAIGGCQHACKPCYCEGCPANPLQRLASYGWLDAANLTHSSKDCARD